MNCNGILVVGSINRDLVESVDDFPQPGLKDAVKEFNHCKPNYTGSIIKFN